jgi:hypothetical protein
MFAGLNLIIKKMKKLFIALVAIVLASCSQDQNESVTPVATTTASVLEGKLLSYKDDASFIKEYSALTAMKSGKEVQKWIAEKGVSSLLNKVDTTEIVQDKMDNTKVIYSDALKAILNSDSKFKIDGKVLWLNERNLYVLSGNNSEKSLEQLKTKKNHLEIYGNISGSKQSNTKSENLTSRTIANANRSIGWSYGYDYGGRARRIDLTLFNETIMLNGNVQSTKMFLRCQRLGRYCSTWKCRWNVDIGSLYLQFGGNMGNWYFNSNLITSGPIGLGYELSDSNNTVLFADGSGFIYPDNFVGSTFVTVKLIKDTNFGVYPSNTISWTQQTNWY